MLSKVKQIKNIVENILKEEWETRDNDRLLMFKVWAAQEPDLRYQEYKLSVFARNFISGEYADPETIRRARQLLQEKHQEYRGKVYYERHKESKKMQKNLYDEFF